MRSFSSVFAVATVVAVEKRGELLSSCCRGSAAWKQTASCICRLECSEAGSLCQHKLWTPGKTTECLLKFLCSHNLCGNVDWVLYLMTDGIPTGVLTTYVGCVGTGNDAGRCRPRTVTLLYTHGPRLDRMVLILYMAPHGSVTVRTEARSHRAGPVSAFVWKQEQAAGGHAAWKALFFHMQIFIVCCFQLIIHNLKILLCGENELSALTFHAKMNCMKNLAFVSIYF